MIEQIKKVVGPLHARVMLMIGRAIIKSVNDAAPAQTIQATLLGDETRDNVERLAEYGFTSVPLPGAKAVAVFVGGDRGHGIIIATGHARYRLTGLEGGEVALYTDEGDKIVLKRGKLIEIVTDTLVVKAATKVRFETPLVEGTGDMIDNVGSDNTRTIAGMRDQYNAHAHIENNVAGGKTGATDSGM